MTTLIAFFLQILYTVNSMKRYFADPKQKGDLNHGKNRSHRPTGLQSDYRK